MPQWDLMLLHDRRPEASGDAVESLSFREDLRRPLEVPEAVAFHSGRRPPSRGANACDNRRSCPLGGLGCQARASPEQNVAIFLALAQDLRLQ
jgi:hypothetical protein